jgi:hypothetical protein
MPLFLFLQRPSQSSTQTPIIMSKVKVTADEAGNVIVQSKNNPEWGHIRVQQVRMVVDDNGFARRKPVSALIHGTIEDLKGFGWTKNQEPEGKIIIKEQLTPFNEKEPERDYKLAGKTGIVCCLDGQPIYRKHFYTTNVEAGDVLVAHNNTDAIRAAYEEQKRKEAASEVEDL